MAKDMRESLQMIVTDCKDDVAAQDGQPLTGKNVAKWNAETLAMVAALANAGLHLLDRIEALEGTDA